MPESESGGPKKPGKSASSAAKPAKSAAKTSSRAAAKKPAKAAAKATSKKPAKTAAKKPPKAAGAAAKTATSAAKKPGTTPRKTAAAKKPAAAAGTSAAKAASSATPARKARSAAPKVTPAVAPPKPLSVATEKLSHPAPPGAPAAPAPAPAPRAPSKRTVVQDTARAYFDALAARDADAAARVWAADGIDDILPLGIFRGVEAIRAFLKELFTAVPDMRFTVERITADDRVAAVQWRSAGTFSAGTFQGLEPTGRRVELRGVDCLEVVDGKIVHNTGVFDGAAFARQVGLLPPEDSGADRAIRAGFNTVTKLRRTVAKRTAR